MLRTAATLVLITALGHIAGTLMPIPAEQTAMLATVATMKATQVPMPIGAPRTYMQILDGNNFCTSLLLLLCAAQLFAVAGVARQAATTRTLVITAAGLAGFAIISGSYFFPAPTVLTAVAAALTLLAL
jgi:hypothetical protein